MIFKHIDIDRVKNSCQSTSLAMPWMHDSGQINKLGLFVAFTCIII